MARNIEDVTGRAVRRRSSQSVGSSLGLDQQPSQPSRPATVPKKEIVGGRPLYTPSFGDQRLPSMTIGGGPVRRRNPEQPTEPSEGPRVGTPGGLGVHEPGTGNVPPGSVVGDSVFGEAPPPLSTGGSGLGFTPSGDPLSDIQRLQQGTPNNDNFLELMNALEEAYPGRVSNVGASARGVWDKIVIDGQTYDLIESATGSGGRWMVMAEGSGGGGGSFAGGGGGGGGTVNVGNDPFSQSIMGAFASLLARPPSGLDQAALGVTGQNRQNQVNPEAQLGVLQQLIQNAPTQQSTTAFPGYEPILDLLKRRQG